MGTTLTREAFLERAKLRCEQVEVPGWGAVWIREPTETQRAHRESELFDSTGNIVKASAAKSRIHMIIDQVMSDPNSPMFTEADADTLGNLSNPALAGIVEAIVAFNARGKNETGKKDESGESNES